MLTLCDPAALTHHKMLVVPRNLKLQWKYLQEICRQMKKIYIHCILSGLCTALNYAKLMLLDLFLDTSTHQKQNIGLRNRELNSMPRSAVQHGSQLFIRIVFSCQAILVYSRCCQESSELPRTLGGEKLHMSEIPTSSSTRWVLWTSASSRQPAKQQNKS